MQDENDDESVIPEIDRTVFKQLVEEGIIQGGMIPKLENSLRQSMQGVKEVIITQASEIHQEKERKFIDKMKRGKFEYNFPLFHLII